MPLWGSCREWAECIMWPDVREDIHLRQTNGVRWPWISRVRDVSDSALSMASRSLWSVGSGPPIPNPGP
jgi:hypothetical protein